MIKNESIVLVVTSEERPFIERCVGTMSEALGPSCPNFKVLQLKKMDELPNFLTKNPTPHVILLDLPNPTAHDRQPVAQILRGLREIDPGICVLLLSENFPTANETMAWLDEGATGLLYRNFKVKEVTEALQEALCKRLNVHLPRTSRAPVRHKLHIRLASLEQALVAETLNVGTGGMFVRVVPADIHMGDHVEFEFVLSQEVSASEVMSSEPNPLLAKMDGESPSLSSTPQDSLPIRGEGVVVWIRASSDRILPEGIGLQFSELEGKAKDWIQKFVATHRIRAFIPKS